LAPQSAPTVSVGALVFTIGTKLIRHPSRVNGSSLAVRNFQSGMQWKRI